MRRIVQSPATWISIVALAVALELPAMAASLVSGATIRPGTIRSLQVANESLTSADIRNGSLQVRDLAPSARASLRGGVGDRGPAGAAGAPGAAGAQGPAGPSWAAAGTTSVGGPASLAGYTASGWGQTFTTPDAGPVLVSSSVQIQHDCGGVNGIGYSCALFWMLAIDGEPVAGSINGLTSFFVGNDNNIRTMYGTVANLPAGAHTMRLYTRVVTAGAATSTLNTVPWSFSVQRVGSVG
jgi:hypothetical protein